MTNEATGRPSTPALFADALSQMTSLFETEIRLVRTELSEKISTAFRAIAVLLAALWVKNGRPGAGWVYFFTLSSIRVTSVALAIVSLHNAVLLQSLAGPA